MTPYPKEFKGVVIVSNSAVNVPKQPKVILTIKQANELVKKLEDISVRHFMDHGEYDYDAFDLADCLQDKIKQAEMSIVST